MKPLSNSVLRLYHLQPSIHTLGPGERFGIWVQGCGLGCKGCLVPQSHDRNGGFLLRLGNLCSKVLDSSCEGVSISGGEPLDQHEALLAFLKILEFDAPELSVMLYSGYTLKQLKDMNSVELLKFVDILVDGGFEQDKAVADPWRGSSNQGIHFLTRRYGVEDYIAAAKVGGVEFHLDNQGQLFQSGIPTSNFEFGFEKTGILIGSNAEIKQDVKGEADER